MACSHSPRVLAIAPGAQHLGLAILEGEELLWFGIRSFAGRKTERDLVTRAARYLNEVVAAHRPDILAVEEPFYAQTRLSTPIRALTQWLKRWGKREGFRVLAYLPTTVKEQLLTGKKTRTELAQAMIDRYWFLYHYRKPGRTRRYWQHMFNAIALGVAAATDAERGQKLGRSRCSDS